MKAIVVHKTEKQPRLSWESVPDISFTEDQVLVDVRATAVNRADLLQARGLYPPPPGESRILGLEMCGIISAVGKRVTGWQIGDKVMALLSGGGYAENVAVHHSLLMPLPEQWTFIQGAAVPEVWLTAYVNLFLEGGLTEGETVLIHAGASGVGTAAIQLARSVGARVLITAGSDAKLKACQKYGADMAINYKSQDFAEEIRSDSFKSGVNLIIDPIGGSYLKKNLAVLAENGRLVNIGLLGGRTAEVDLAVVLGKSLRLIGSRLRHRSLSEKIRITDSFQKRFRPLFDDGRLVPVVDSVFPVRDVHSAHDYVRRNENIGKVILEME